MKLYTHKSPGPNLVYPMVLKEAESVIVLTLNEILNQATH